MKGREIRRAIPKTGVRRKDRRIGENNNFLESLQTSDYFALASVLQFKVYDCRNKSGETLSCKHVHQEEATL